MKNILKRYKFIFFASLFALTLLLTACPAPGDGTTDGGFDQEFSTPSEGEFNDTGTEFNDTGTDSFDDTGTDSFDDSSQEFDDSSEGTDGQ